MSTILRSRPIQVLSKLVLIVLCTLCLQFLCGCASKSGDEGAVDQAIKYATSRTLLELSSACVVKEMPDATIEISLLGLEDTASGVKEIKVVPVVISDTMASWGADEWAENRLDLFFNFVAHFKYACKQANEYGDVPADYTVTCPDYMVVYDSQKNTGFIVNSTGVYQKTDDPENPIGEPVVITSQD